MKKTLLTALALGAFLANKLEAQTWTTTANGKLYANPTSTKIGIGMSDPNEALEVNGTVKANMFSIQGASPNSILLELKNGSNPGSGPYVNTLKYSSNTLTNFQESYNTSLVLINGTYLKQTPSSILLSSFPTTNTTNSLRIGTENANRLSLLTNNMERIRITGTGYIGVGTITPLTPLHVTGQTIIGDLSQGQLDAANASGVNYKLLVSGGIMTEKFKVAPKTGPDWSWPDYVFSKNYKLNTLDSVENFINKNSHLPDVPSAKEISTNGFDVAEMDAKLLRKVEELTLYVIEISKKEKENKEEVAILKKKIEALETENKELKK